MEIRARHAVVDIGIIDDKIRFISKKIIQDQLLVFHRTSPFLVILHGKPDIQCYMNI